MKSFIFFGERPTDEQILLAHQEGIHLHGAGPLDPFTEDVPARLESELLDPLPDTGLFVEGVVTACPLVACAAARVGLAVGVFSPYGSRLIQG